MLVARKGKSIRVPVMLLDDSNAPVSGMVPANLNDNVSGAANVSIVKGDGTVSSLLLDGSSWFEISAARIPGLYHIVLPASATDVVGTLQIGVRADATEFVTAISSIMVEEFYLSALIAKNRWKIDTGTNQLIYYDDDGTTAIATFDLKDALGNPTVANPAERTPV